MPILPPQHKSYTVDNVSGSAITPKSTCGRIIIVETSDPPVGFSITINATTVAYAAGDPWDSLNTMSGYLFTEGVQIGTIVAASGTITVRQIEGGRGK